MFIDVNIDTLVRLVRILHGLLCAQLGRYQLRPNPGIHARADTHRQHQLQYKFLRHFLMPKYMRSPMMNAMLAPLKSSSIAKASALICTKLPSSVANKIEPTAT